jgi:cell wall-associated NlpC family hydrolase
MVLPGDVILYPVTPGSSFASKLIAFGELLLGRGRGREEYSHVGIALDRGWQFESVWPRARLSRIDERRPREAWRMKGIGERQRQEILWWCRRAIGRPYDLLYVLSFTLIRNRKEDVCSTFARDAYRAAGLHLPAATPDDIAGSSMMYRLRGF